MYAVGIIILLLILLGIMVAAVWGLRMLVKYLTNTRSTASPEDETKPMKTTSNGDTTSPLTGLADSLTWRSLIIGVLALIMLIPLALVGGIVNERGYRYQSVLHDIAGNWGNEQTTLAPILSVPFTEIRQIEESIIAADGKPRTISKQIQQQRTAHFLPDSLNLTVSIQDEFRRRGIFESLVYAADISIAADFPDINPEDFPEKVQTIHWEKSWVSIGLSDTRAINSVSAFNWQDKEHELSPGTRLDNLPSGFHAMTNSIKTDIDGAGPPNTLELSMNINGSGAFRFAPFGKRTQVTMTSSWPHPSFQGDALPDEHTVKDSGFTASWDIPHLARNYPQRWYTPIDYYTASADQYTTPQSQYNLHEFTAGVSMFEPLSLYTLVTRSVKYGILFIGLTFLTLFIFEMSIRRRLHIVQYALIGVALSLFYLVLLSLSEHIPFVKAYLSAATLTILMITGYTWVVLRNFLRALAVFIMLVALYAVLYSLLQLEDYALMMGTALLVFVVVVLMFVTRNIHAATTLNNEG